MFDRANIKICGITRVEDARLAIDLGAFALGFIFYEKSPRYIEPHLVRAIIEALRPSPSLRLVGIFVNADAERVRSVAAISGIDTLQFHGDETAEYCAGFSDHKIWKAFRLKSAEQFLELPAFESLRQVEAFLFDAAVPGQYGGTGHIGDWDLLEKVPRNRALIVSGGLHAGNAGAAWERFRPFALDLSSGVESLPGIKSSEKLKLLFDMKG